MLQPLGTTTTTINQAIGTVILLAKIDKNKIPLQIDRQAGYLASCPDTAEEGCSQFSCAAVLLKRFPA